MFCWVQNYTHPCAFFGFILYVCLKQGSVWNIYKANSNVSIKWTRAEGTCGKDAYHRLRCISKNLPPFWPR